MDDKKKEELEREFDEAYRLAMEMVIEKRGGDRSIVYKKLMDNAPNIGMIVVERDAVYEGCLLYTSSDTRNRTVSASSSCTNGWNSILSSGKMCIRDRLNTDFDAFDDF